ncbi:MAG: class II aldolase/adducin family protein [Patescibacteria group bacterium]|jgi:L-fuculose-phosphate aldolase
MGKEKYIGTKFNIVFTGNFKPTTLEKELIKEMIKAGKQAGKMGMKDKNGGNISVKTKDGFIIKRTGAHPDSLKISDFVLVVKADKDTVWVKGQYEPSSESRLHYFVYQARPDIGCIFHAHDFLVLESKQKIKEVICLKPYSYGTIESARAVSKVAKKHDYIIQANHGVIALGKNVKSSLDLIIKYHEKFK